MALTGTETYGEVKAGFVTDEDGLLSTTRVGTEFANGFLRDDDGRLAITVVDDGTEFGTVIPGFLTNAEGALVVTGNPDGAVDGTVVPGLWTSPSGALIVESGTAAPVNDGRKFPVSSDGYVAINKNYLVAAEAVGDLAYMVSLGASGGLTDLSGNGVTSTNNGGNLTIGGATGPLATGDEGATNFPNITGRFIDTDYDSFTGDRTFMFWINRTSVTSMDTVFGTTLDGYIVRAQNNGTWLASANNIANNAFLTDVTEDVWVHMAVVFDIGTSITWYLNGAEEVDPYVFGWNLAGHALRVGQGAATTAVHGDMAWVSVHNKALSDAEVNAIRNAGT